MCSDSEAVEPTELTDLLGEAAANALELQSRGSHDDSDPISGAMLENDMIETDALNIPDLRRPVSYGSALSVKPKRFRRQRR